MGEPIFAAASITALQEVELTTFTAGIANPCFLAAANNFVTYLPFHISTEGQTVIILLKCVFIHTATTVSRCKLSIGVTQAAPQSKTIAVNQVVRS